jgi:hypothetical protein
MFEIGTAVTTLRSLAGVVKEAGKIELYQKVLELQQTLLELVSQNTELAEKNHTLFERVRALESDLARMRARGTLEFDGQVYWSGNPGEPSNGPLCPRCYDKEERHARMTDRGNGFTCCATCDYCVGNEDLRYPNLRLSPPWDSSGSDRDTLY